MNISADWRLAALSTCLVLGAAAMAQGTAAPAGKAASAAAAGQAANMDVLKGTWVRPDGGYVISVKSVGADGKLEAQYQNPATLPFARAQASREGATLHAFFELRAGGYNGSTYDLSYEPLTDRLTGIYFQAVQQQKYEIHFVRK